MTTFTLTTAPPSIVQQDKALRSLFAPVHSRTGHGWYTVEPYAVKSLANNDHNHYHRFCCRCRKQPT